MTQIEFHELYQDHIKYLSGDATATLNPDIDSNFSGVDFTGINFNGMNISGANFSNCIFTDAQMLCCTFKGCNFNGAVFNNTSMEASDFSESTFRFTRFRSANCSKSDFSKSFFNHVYAEETKFDHTFFNEAFIQGCKFNRCSFVDTIMEFTEFYEVETAFYGCMLAGFKAKGITGFKYISVEKSSVDSSKLLDDQLLKLFSRKDYYKTFLSRLIKKIIKKGKELNPLKASVESIVPHGTIYKAEID